MPNAFAYSLLFHMSNKEEESMKFSVSVSPAKLAKEANFDQT